MSEDTVSVNDRRQAASACKRYRAAKRISQSDLATRLGTYQTVISQAESAYPTVPPKIVRAILDLTV